MGNIVGEKFDKFVVDQINARQTLYGRGFETSNLSSSNLLLLNGRNAWLKLASSVKVVNEEIKENSLRQTFIDSGVPLQSTKVDQLGTQRLRDLDINNTEDFLGNKLAQKTVLFNTLTQVTDNNKFATPRSGVADTNSLFNLNNSYGIGGTKFGINPSPGLVSAEITNLNRGSIRNANVTIKAFNQFQFELIELVYLRLGFTMMLEWGFDKFVNNEGNIENTGTTLIENNFFTDKPLSQLEMLQNIEYYRELYQGNYDGFFGKVVNFDWNFNKNGSYDINLKLVTLGDVIESIKAKTVAQSLTVKEIGELLDDPELSEEDKERIEALKDSSIVNNAGSSPLAQSLYIDVIKPDKWNGDDKNYFSWNSLSEFFEEELDKQNFSITFGKLYGLSTVPENPLKNNDQYSYYMTFYELLNRLSEYCVPSIGNNNNIEKQIQVIPRDDNYLCSAFPNQISFDPLICLIRPVFTSNMVGDESVGGNYIKQWDWIPKLKQFGFLSDDSTVLYGNIMNIYLNYDFISKCLSNNMDEDGNISLYKFLTRICDGINSSLGDFQQLEVVIRDDIFVTIQDQNPIPGMEKIEPNTEPSIAPFEIFGFNTSGSFSSNFVTDFSFNTKITPQLASSISIGTTANNITTKNYDGTAFSKWNSGLQDRFASFYADPSQVSIKSTKYTYSSVLSDEQIEAEWKAWSNRAKFKYEKRKTTQVDKTKNKGEQDENKKEDGENKKFILFNKPGNPTSKQSAYARNIKSPSSGKVYARTIFLFTLTWPQYITQVISDVQAEKNRLKAKDYTREELDKFYKNDYNWYLIRAFSGNLGGDKVKEERRGIVTALDAQYFLMDGSFIAQGKSAFQAYINTNINNKQFKVTNNPSNTIGFIPADLGLTFKGLSGIKIYQQLAVRQDFLPKQYPKALKFLIKGVNHSISNNDWSTNLSTLSIPNVKAEINLDPLIESNTSTLADGEEIELLEVEA